MLRNSLIFCYRVALTLILFALLSIPALVVTPHVPSDIFSFKADTLKCAIAIKHNIRNSGIKNVGFNYELLGAFGDSNSSVIKIDAPIESPECWEQLINGQLQIVAFDANDTIPAQYADLLVESVPVKGDDVWVTTMKNRSLVNAVNVWFYGFQNQHFFEEMAHRYFRSYNVEKLAEKNITVTALSPYDDIVKKYSSNIGIDWRLLSAIIYQESKFSMGVSSTASAKGLMQIKAATAAKYGIDDIYDPDSNVNAGTMHFNHLLNYYRNQEMDSVNVIKFALAAYNAGESKIEARRAEAERKGYDPDVWEDILESVGRYNGPTATYINEILKRYELYKSVID